MLKVLGHEKVEEKRLLASSPSEIKLGDLGRQMADSAKAFGNREDGRRTVVVRTESWEEFEAKIREFDDPAREVWDETWFRGQADAQWALLTTLERRSPKIRAVRDYLHIISEIKPALETFTGATFAATKPEDIEGLCREFDRFQFAFAEGLTYMAHLRHGGFPSPLLDWSNSPYVAAYFAFARAHQDGDVAVYAYRERPSNFKVGGSGIPQIESFGPNLRTHKRHFRQQSRYTICVAYVDGQWYFTPHDSVFGIKDPVTHQDFLWKITIPAKERLKALKYFDKFNLNEFTLFDSEEGLLEMLATRIIDMRNPA